MKATIEIVEINVNDVVTTSDTVTCTGDLGGCPFL